MQKNSLFHIDKQILEQKNMFVKECKRIMDEVQKQRARIKIVENDVEANILKTNF